MATSSVRVVLRFRPLNKTEREEGPESCVEFASDTEVAILGRDHIPLAGERVFTYDGVLNPLRGQEDVFKLVGEPTVGHVMRGYNGTILAYGQTGSGKTHSMLGPEGGTVDVLTPSSPEYVNRGVIPRIVETLFERLQALPSAEVTWKIHVSVFELYRETIQDLLTEGPQQDYRIREDTINGRGIYVDNLHSKRCRNASELLEAIQIGVSRRKVASTKSNETSSRSHSLTVITLEQVSHVQQDTVTVSRLNLVDLAGSEKVAKTQATGDRLKEAQTINLSLTLLGNVIYKLTDGKSGYIPYRNSKLTRILQDSFGGNSITTLMCHCSVSNYNRDETISTLRFASRAKQIRNKPRVNRDLSQKELQLAYAQALDRIRSLEEKIQILSPAGSSQISPSRRGSPPRSEAEGSSVVCSDPSHADLHDTITNLLVEVEDLKRDLYGGQEELAKSKQQIEFYKSKAIEWELLLTEGQSRAKREEALFQRRLLDLQAENDRLQGELDVTGGNMVPRKSQQSLLAASVAQSNQIPSENSRDVQHRTIGGGHIGNLRRLGEREVERRAVSGGVGGEVNTLHSVEALSPVTEFGVSSHPVAASPSGNTDNLIPAHQRHLTGPIQAFSLQQQQQPGFVRQAHEVPLAGGSSGVLPAPCSMGAFAGHVDCGVQVQLGKPEAELLLAIEVGEGELRRVNLQIATLLKKMGEKDAAIERLGLDVEVTNNRNDELLRELDNLRQLLEAREKENGMMRRILEELNINIEEQMALLGSEQQRNAWLKSEADKLRQRAQTLQDSQEQQEYCDMATMELMVKAEDMDAVENELGFISYSALTGGVVSEGTRLSCQDTLRQLHAFLTRLLDTLQGRVFNTSNLESQRLSIVSDAVKLQDRVESAQSLLTESVTPSWIREPTPRVVPSAAASQTVDGSRGIDPRRGSMHGGVSLEGGVQGRPTPPVAVTATKGARRVPSSSAISAAALGRGGLGLRR